MSLKISFDFKKAKMSLSAQEFMLGIYNPVEEEASTELKDNLQKAIEGANLNLKVKDANYLLQKILTALTTNNDESDDIINQELQDKKISGKQARVERKCSLLKLRFRLK